jgi:hypothetical protein
VREEPFQFVAIRPSLWRWTARHPAWRPGAARDGPADWPPDVGCVAYPASDAFVLIDPLVPAQSETRFWQAMDVLIEAHGGPVAVLTTIKFHRRSRDAFVERYGASTSRAKSALPEGVRSQPIRGAGEVMFWLPAHRALVPGDRILGGRRGGLRLCPESWLGYLGSGMTREKLRERLRPLLELPIEMVLVSHGEPVLGGGRDALAAAIEETGS